METQKQLSCCVLLVGRRLTDTMLWFENPRIATCLARPSLGNFYPSQETLLCGSEFGEQEREFGLVEYLALPDAFVRYQGARKIC
jgi:hypothetical protein